MCTGEGGVHCLKQPHISHSLRARRSSAILMAKINICRGWHRRRHYMDYARRPPNWFRLWSRNTTTTHTKNAWDPTRVGFSVIIVSRTAFWRCDLLVALMMLTASNSGGRAICESLIWIQTKIYRLRHERIIWAAIIADTLSILQSTSICVQALPEMPDECRSSDHICSLRYIRHAHAPSSNTHQ